MLLVQAIIDTRRPESGAEQLALAVAASAAQEQVFQDLCYLARELEGHLDYVLGKLELVGDTRCPRFHADTVGLRSLVTYSGPGTWYIENRYVN